MKVHTLGIDLAKNVFQLHGIDRKGRTTLTRRVHRDQLLRIVGELEPCVIGIEASTGAFYWQRQFEKLGHCVKIIAPQYVKPFVRRQKNDTNDAEAICTALQQHNMRFVPKKTLEQQDIQAPCGRDGDRDAVDQSLGSSSIERSPQSWRPARSARGSPAARARAKACGSTIFASGSDITGQRSRSPTRTHG
jgi:Transposase